MGSSHLFARAFPRKTVMVLYKSMDLSMLNSDCPPPKCMEGKNRYREGMDIQRC